MNMLGGQRLRQRHLRTPDFAHVEFPLGRRNHSAGIRRLAVGLVELHYREGGWKAFLEHDVWQGPQISQVNSPVRNFSRISSLLCE